MSGAPRLSRLFPIVLCGAFALLVVGVAPGLSLRDAGELTTAGYTLGVAHETGFALWCLLARAATLIPLGEIALRVALLSAACGALAAALVACLVRDLVDDEGGDARLAEVAGGIAAALLLAGYTFWRASTVAEVYAPTAAAMAGALVLLRRAAEGDRRAGLALALLAGLALGLHASFRLLLWPSLAVLTAWRLRRGDRWPLVAPLLFALGAAIVVYAPLAAARAPLADWGEPRTIGKLIDELLAVRIRRAFAGEILDGNWHHLAHHARAFFGIVEAELGAPALAFAVAGLAWLLARRRALGLVVLAMAAGDVLYAIAINPMGVADWQCGVPLALAVAVCAGVAIGRLARRLSLGDHPPVRRSLGLALACALGGVCVAPAALADADARFAMGDEAATWTTAALRDAPSRALVLLQSDDLASGALYASGACGLRPDLTILVRQELWDAPYLERAVTRGGRQATTAPVLAAWRARPESERVRRSQSFLRALLDENLALGRAVLWEAGDDRPPVGRLVPGVPLAHLASSRAPLPSPRPLVKEIDELLGRARDPLAVRLAASALDHLADAWLADGDADAGAALYRSALVVQPEDAVAATNLAVLRAGDGHINEALALVERVLAREPGRVVARENAGRYRLALGDLEGARRDFERARKESPRSPSPLVGLARVAERQGDRDAARRFAAEALRLAPDDTEARALVAP